MSDYWQEWRDFHLDGFDCLVSRHYDDTNPRDSFDCFESKEEEEEFFRKIEDGVYEWFGFRVQAFKHGVLLGEASLWGCCYENPDEIFTDGTCDDVASQAVFEADQTLKRILEHERATA